MFKTELRLLLTSFGKFQLSTLEENTKCTANLACNELSYPLKSLGRKCGNSLLFVLFCFLCSYFLFVFVLFSLPLFFFFLSTAATFLISIRNYLKSGGNETHLFLQNSCQTHHFRQQITWKYSHTTSDTISRKKKETPNKC